MTTTHNLSSDEEARPLFEGARVLRPRDLAARGIPPRYASRLAKRGMLKRVDRGL